jgi:hypothetical protein
VQVWSCLRKQRLPGHRAACTRGMISFQSARDTALLPTGRRNSGRNRPAEFRRMQDVDDLCIVLRKSDDRSVWPTNPALNPDRSSTRRPRRSEAVRQGDVCGVQADPDGECARQRQRRCTAVAGSRMEANHEAHRGGLPTLDLSEAPRAGIVQGVPGQRARAPYRAWPR